MLTRVRNLSKLPDLVAALVPQSRLEPHLSLGMNFGFGYGPMLGGRMASLFGPGQRSLRPAHTPTDFARTSVTRRGPAKSAHGPTAGRQRNYRGTRIWPEFAERRTGH
ncbi:hypothetical protein ACFWF7_08540 [Nocardia sp. NPDC060256]|uniref:hypothetical protein n=1 Tax=unclassified Nocardia TaxID=2637762 RepID=UPI0036666564